MGHGYMREYDEDRSDDRDRWRDDDGRERGWRGRDWNDRGNERNREFMLGDRDRSWERNSRSDRDRDRGFFDRMGDRARTAFSDDDREARGRTGRDREQDGFGGRSDWERSPRNFGSGQDDHYRSWRDKQMESLDRDYADYCREREQQFHSDFDAWRGQRTKGNQQPLRTGMTQTAEEVMDLTDEATQGRPEVTSTPMGAATVGTNSSTDSTPGRARR